MPRNTSVRLGEHFNGFVEGKIQQGRFESTSEAIRAGLSGLTHLAIIQNKAIFTNTQKVTIWLYTIQPIHTTI